MQIDEATQRKRCAPFASISPAVRKSCGLKRSSCRRRARARSGCASTRSGSTSSTSIIAPVSIRRRRPVHAGFRGRGRGGRGRHRRSRGSSPATASPMPARQAPTPRSATSKPRFLFKLPARSPTKPAAAMMLKGLTAQYLLRQTYRVKGRHDPRPCRGRRRRAHPVPMGQGARRDGDRLRRHAGKGRARQKGGAKHTILYRDEDFAKRVGEITKGAKCHVVYDGVGKATFPASLDCLRPFGVFASFGSASGQLKRSTSASGAERLAVRDPADPDHVHGGSGAGRENGARSFPRRRERRGQDPDRPAWPLAEAARRTWRSKSAKRPAPSFSYRKAASAFLAPSLRVTSQCLAQAGPPLYRRRAARRPRIAWMRRGRAY